MSLGVVTGFAPAPGVGIATPGAGTPAAGPAAAGSPLGFFDAILAMLTGDASGEAPRLPSALPAEQQQALVDFIGRQLLAGAAGDADTPPAEGAVVVSVEAGTEAALPPGTAPASPKALLVSLVEQLAALQQALAGDAPIDPKLERKLGETLDALAAALGVALPQPPAVDPAISAAAEVGSNAGLDPLATIEAGAAAATPASGPTGPAGPAVADVPTAPAAPAAPAPTGAVTAAPEGVAAAGGAPTPPAPAAPAPTGTELPAGSTDAAAYDKAPAPADLPPAVAALADRIVKLAAALETRAPGLANKLEALGKALAAGEIAPARLAALGLVETETDTPDPDLAGQVARLLAPAVDPRPRPQPVPFATPNLALPTGAPGDSEADATAEEDPATRPLQTRAPEAPADADAAPRQPAAVRPAAATAPVTPGPQPETHDAGTTTLQAKADAADPAPGAQQPAAASAAVPGTISAEARAMHAAYRPAVQHINVPQLAVEIVRQVEAGATRFQIRLDPPELGRVEVKLDVDKAGNVHARMTVDRAETLDLMQRDQRALERALAQAGLDSSKTNLEFSLRQNPFARDGQGQQQGGQHRPDVPRFGSPASAEAPAPTILAYRAASAPGGINLFV